MIHCADTLLRACTPSTHGGVDAAELARLGIDPAAVIDFSANQSPLGCSPRVADAIANACVESYPDRKARPLVEAIAAHHGLSPAQVAAGNGSTELIRLIAQLALRSGDRAFSLTPTFGEYVVATELVGVDLETYTLLPETSFALDPSDFQQRLVEVSPRVCWLCGPNNPTGTALRPEVIVELVHRFPGTLFVLDEAYCDLLPDPQWTPELLEHGNLIILRSMTKAWGLAGLRLGYALGSASLMQTLKTALPPWNVNACAQAAGIAALADTEHYARTIALLREEKQTLVSGLQAQGWQVLPSAAAFFLVYTGDAAKTKLALLKHGLLVRDCTSFGLPQYIRISPRHPEQNKKLLAAMSTLKPGGA